MEDQQTTPAKIALNFGMILGMGYVLSGLVSYSQDMHYKSDQTIGIIDLIFTVTVIMAGIIQFKKVNYGFLTLTEALKTGLGIAVVSGMIFVIYYFILTGIIDPETLDKSLEFQKQKMLSINPEMSIETAENFKNNKEKNSSPLINTASVFVASLFTGFVISLIGGLIVKKSRPE